MLIRKIEKFLRRTDMAPTRFGMLSIGDPTFVFDLRRGREPRRRMEARVEHFMNTYLETVDAAQS